MPSSEGKARSAAARVSSTRWPCAPAGARSDATSTKVSTPRKGARLGCPATWGRSIAIDSSAIFMSVQIQRFTAERAETAERMSQQGAAMAAIHRYGSANLAFSTVKSSGYVRLQRRQAAHLAHFVDREHAGAQQDLVHLRLFTFVARFQFGEGELQIVPAEFLGNGVAREVLGEEARGGHDGGAKGVIAQFFGGGTVHVVLQAEEERRKVEGIGHDAKQELLPFEAQVGVGAAAETEYLRLVLGGEDGHAPGAFDLVLPPADQPVVLGGAEVLEPEGVLHYRVRGQARGVAVGGEELVDGLKRHFQPAKPERGVGARVQADVDELVVVERDLRVRTHAAGGLHVARRVGAAVPVGADPDGGAVHRPQDERARGIAGALDFDGAEAADQHVFQHLLGEGAEGVVGVGRLEIRRQDADAPGGVGQGRWAAPGARLHAPAHAAMRSLMVLMALRATGVSAKRRRLAGVALGSVSARGPWTVRIEGSGCVRRFAGAPLRIRPMRPRTECVIFMVLSSAAINHAEASECAAHGVTAGINETRSN